MQFLYLKPVMIRDILGYKCQNNLNWFVSTVNYLLKSETAIIAVYQGKLLLY